MKNALSMDSELVMLFFVYDMYIGEEELLQFSLFMIMRVPTVTGLTSAKYENYEKIWREWSVINFYLYCICCKLPWFSVKELCALNKRTYTKPLTTSCLLQCGCIKRKWTHYLFNEIQFSIILVFNSLLILNRSCSILK